ncbi:WXG100 family type VII secretion target [Catenulispora yoronensis]|uniref:WXG100 family type VII secretion target n=1 Tax=Catenulispora yoronensis TaxID=450799 RepID=A0ABN2UQM1_9ACTN
MTKPVSTDFSQYSLTQLTHMLYESDPATGVNTAQAWDATGKMLHEQASNLEGRLRNFDDEWRGTASDEYKRMVSDLIGGIRKVADTSLQMRDLTYDAVDSLTKARAAMPAPVDIPTVTPATLALATTPLPIDAATPAPVVAQMQTDQAKAMAAVDAQQSAIGAASAAHAQAVTVMKTLASSYVVAQNRFPPAPDAAPATPGGPPPTVAAGSTPIGPLDPAPGGQLSLPGSSTLLPQPVQTGGANPAGSDNPLFGDMYTVGLAAAAAAVAGKFAGSATPGGLSPLQPVPNNSALFNASNVAQNQNQDQNKDKNKDGSADKRAAADAAGVLGSRFLANKLGKLGGGGGASLGGGSGIDPNAAKAAADAAKNLAVAEGAAVNDFAGGAMGQAAAAAAGRAGMMPMMPMSGMAGAGMGDAGNRRIPPWLVETEDVWGASSPVSPGLIGGDL